MKSVQFYYADDIHLNVWNAQLAIQDGLIDFIKMLHPHTSLNVSFDGGRLRVAFPVNMKRWDDCLRVQCYALTKSLLRSSILFTYNVIDNSTLELVIDFSANINKLYSVEVENKLNILFHNSLMKYEVSLDKINRLSADATFRLNANGIFEKVESLDKELASFSNRSYADHVLHIPFLFRPITLIIPKGKERFDTSVRTLLERDADLYTRANFFVNSRSLFVNFFKVLSSN